LLDVAAVADSLHVTNFMLKQILDGLMQPLTYDARDRMSWTCSFCNNKRFCCYYS